MKRVKFPKIYILKYNLNPVELSDRKMQVYYKVLPLLMAI